MQILYLSKRSNSVKIIHYKEKLCIQILLLKYRNIIISVLLMCTVLPQCNAPRKWRRCSQLGNKVNCSWG